jgi:hypothetical protein
MIAKLAALLAAVAPAAAVPAAPAVPPARPESPAMSPNLSDTARALTLDVAAHDGMLEVRLTGLSERARGVSYSLEVTGTSTSRHHGSTRLAAGTHAVLSTMRTSAGADWCVRLIAEEEGSAPYEITRGTCAAG